MDPLTYLTPIVFFLLLLGTSILMKLSFVTITRLIVMSEASYNLNHSLYMVTAFTAVDRQ